MPINIEMPRLSDTMQAGTVVKWNVKEGQKVKSGDVIADIETDKATMELQSFDDGTVASIPVPEGKSVPIGTTILVLATGNEDAAKIKASGGGGSDQAAAQPVQPTPAKDAHPKGDAAAEAERSGRGSVVEPKGSPSPAQSRPSPRAQPVAPNGSPVHEHSTGGRVFASPLARKVAAESGVDLADIQGTGPGGRIVRADVEAAAGAPGARASRPAPLPAAAAVLEARTVPLSSMRRTIAERLVQSKQTIPHYQVTVEADMDALMSLRSQLNEQLAAQGVKLSVNDFLVRACALAMHRHPFVNSRWSGTAEAPALEVLGNVNIGIAIAIDEAKGGGLLVATIRDADQIGLRQISAQSKQYSEKARGKGLSIQDMSDSTFTISNLGMFGVSHFTAIINPPNAAILAVGAAVQRPVVKNGQVVPGYVMSMTMSSDHRIIDGAMAARYLSTVRELLEKPATLLV